MYGLLAKVLVLLHRRFRLSCAEGNAEFTPSTGASPSLVLANYAPACKFRLCAEQKTQ